MGLSVAIAGGISCVAVLGVLSILFSVTDQTYEINSAREENFAIENILVHSNATISDLSAQAGSDKISLSLENTGLEKLWNYDKFTVLVSYNASIGGTPRLVSEQLTYNSAQSFGSQGCAIVPNTAGRWVIDSITNDHLDPRIINSGETGNICIKLSNVVYNTSTNNVIISTNYGKAISKITITNGNATVPGVPTGLTATTASSSQINLSWTAPADNGGSAITGYKIERESPVGGGWSTLVSNTGSTSTSYSDTGLFGNTQYNYRVSAINAMGTGSASSAANATTSIGSPTRVYFSAAGSAAVSPSFDSWSETDSSLRRPILTAKSASESLATGTQVAWTAGNTQLDRQYVSPPMEGGISFASVTIKLQLQCQESTALDHSRPRMSAKIVSQDGSTLKQTLLTIANYGTNSDYNSLQLTNIKFADGDSLTGSYITASGDRLVIEIGHSDTSGLAPKAQCRYGAPSGTSDLGENNSDTGSLVPWAEFSNQVRFQAGP